MTRWLPGRVRFHRRDRLSPSSRSSLGRDCPRTPLVECWSLTSISKIKRDLPCRESLPHKWLAEFEGVVPRKGALMLDAVILSACRIAETTAHYVVIQRSGEIASCPRIH